MLDSVKRTLKLHEVEILEDIEFKSLTTIRCGGIASIVVLPKTLNEYLFVLRYLTERDIPFKVVGNMSNVLPPDGVYDSVIIRTTPLNHITFAGNIVTADCGAKISSVLWQAAKMNLGGGEGLFMIPGTLGGMVYQNAGAYGVSISDIFLEGKFYDSQTDEVVTLAKADMDFSYRHSLLSSRRLYMLSMRLLLHPVAFENVKKRITELAKMRRVSQPTAYPSLGSIFRRDGDFIPAKVIDELGFKGMYVGGAMVSEKHAGFIVNQGSATSSDIKALIQIIKKTVSDKLSLDLSLEIEYLE